jgi:hypothetical protein
MCPSTYRWLAFLVATFVVGSATAKECAAGNDPCGKQTEWNEFESIHLRVIQDGAPTVLESNLQTSRKNNDLRVDIEISDPKEPQHGTILMVGGRVFVSKGMTLTRGAEIDALDGPVLYSILVGKVLSRALPSGPDVLTGPQKVAHRDETTGIQFATPSAQGFISPPWSVTGSVTPQPDHSFEFDLLLKWSDTDPAGAKLPVTLTLKGNLKHESDFRLDDNMPLAGWSVFGVGPIVEKTGSSTRFDYGAKPVAQQPRTIADIRRQLEIEDSPGRPDLTLNLAGFWKEKCSEGFGLRIKPVDKPGLYTVAFCGPGGCGDEQYARKSFIAGDKHYKVVSPVELQVLGNDGNWSTYRKCSGKMLP